MSSLKIAVISAGDGWHVRDLTRAAEGRAVDIVPITFRRLSASVDAGSSRQYGAAQSETRAGGPAMRLDQFRGLLVRTMPAGSLEQVVFRMDVLHQVQASGVAVTNSPRALEAAIDKYVTTARLRTQGLPVPTTAICENADDACQAFVDLGGDVVVKPVFGSEGHGIHRISDPDLAARSFRMLERLGAVIYLQRFVAHAGYDLRAFVIGGRVVAAMRRQHDRDWRTNVARGATPLATELTELQIDLAVRSAAAVGAVIAGVDLLPARSGELLVLEVNAVPGWRALTQATGVDVAAAVVDHVVGANASRPAPDLAGGRSCDIDVQPPVAGVCR